MKITLIRDAKAFSVEIARSPERAKERACKAEAKFQKTMAKHRSAQTEGDTYTNCVFNNVYPVVQDQRGVECTQDEAVAYVAARSGFTLEMCERILDFYRQFWQDKKSGAKG